MSDESISKREDKENLQYIAQGIHVQEQSFVEDHGVLRDSVIRSESDISLGKVGSDIKFLNKYSSLGPNLLSDFSIFNKTRPFEFKWSFGLNSKVRIKNLSDTENNQFIFASAHLPIIYDTRKSSMNHLEGHSDTVKDVTCSNDGKFIVTVDSGKHGNIIFWENKQCGVSLIYTIFEPYTYAGIEIMELSGSAKYLITIGSTSDGNRSVDFWIWSKGDEKPNDSYIVPGSYGNPMRICFNPNTEEHIMIVFENNIFLMVWDQINTKLTNIVNPVLLHKSKIGHFTDGTYVSECHECFTSSDTGCVSVFGNTLYPKPFDEGELDNSKIFRNSVKVSTGSILCCTTTEDLLVTADSNGEIHFFDKKVRILYWLNTFNLGPILSLTFNLTPKFEYEGDNHYIMRKPFNEEYYSEGFEDITEELAVLSKKDLPEAATLTKDPFLVRDFLVSTESSNVYMIDCVSNKCVPVFQVDAGMVTAIETHGEFDYLLIGYESGAIISLNYNTNTKISHFLLPEADSSSKKNAVTCIKYSINSFHLVCGRANGEIWILGPTLLNPKAKPFTATNSRVIKIDFAPNQFAYYDENRTVVLFNYNAKTSKWAFMGKLRSHYNNIHDIMFVPERPNYKLYTISKDRHIVEYNTKKGGGGDKFEIVSSVRVDQSAIPICFTYWYDEKKIPNIFVSDSDHKLKFLYQSTKIPRILVLGPAYGCFKNDCIRKMSIVPNCKSRYMVFATNKQLGLHILPPDGNPYKYVGYLADPSGLKDFKLSHDGKYVMTFASNHSYVFKWEILTRGVELMHVSGGKELEPFYCLIEGGARGSLFQEIKDLFYYMQILQQENLDMPRRVSDSISVTEIPDLVRACGFYPSEFELENMMIDIRYRNFNETQKTNEEINFIDFVKLYCNHKPAYGYSLEEVEEAYNFLAKHADYFVDVDAISKEELIDIFTTMGEPMSQNSAFKCFTTLLRNYDEEETFDFLPETITFAYFRDDLFGIDMTRDKFQEGDGSEASSVVSFDKVKE